MARPRPVNGCIIPLTQGYETVVDAVDVEWAAAFNWYVLKAPNGALYAARVRRVNDATGSSHVLLHREVLRRMETVEGVQCDHRDRNPLNNRRGNLRSATQSQNLANQPPRNIRVDGKRSWLGLFNRESAAARAYDAAAVKAFGEFAWVNFPLSEGPC